MNIGVISDIHVETHRDIGISFASTYDNNDIDVLVIAGDFGPANDDFITPAMTVFCNRFPHIVYVPGNHEYYGSDWEYTESLITEFSDRTPNFHWLNNSHVTIDDQRFIGGTLWFDDEYCSMKSRMNDFKLIKKFEPEVYKRNDDTTRFLNKSVLASDIVVTHHLPYQDSIKPMYASSPFNVYFLHDMSNLINYIQPKLWIHGHTHESCNYNVGNTRIVCNPFGNLYLVNRNFDNRFIVNI